MDFYIEVIPWWAVQAYALIAGAVGVWRGGRDGRFFAALILYFVVRANVLPLPGVREVWRTPLIFYPEGVLMVVVGLVGVLRGRAYWTVWAAATQLLGFATDMLEIYPGMSKWSYYSAQRAWFIVLISAVLLGSLLSPRAGKAALGVEPSAGA